mmetsp:Transcript_23456/g.69088  ORF Transcript_23456/g.69088 Transcript_23456/m.69088 type:complete len:208 (-) Transcript_23456:116-739(-)
MRHRRGGAAHPWPLPPSAAAPALLGRLCVSIDGIWARGHPHFDAVALVAHVEDALLDLVVDGACGGYEGVLHVGGGLGGRLQEDEAVLLGELLPLLVGHGSAVLKVRLVADEHDGHVGVGVLARVLEPRGEVVEGLPARDVVDEEGARGAAVVGPRDGPEGLLARCVPDLQLDLLVVDGDHARPKLHADGQVVHGLEALVGELQQEA